ncbi:MAG: enoyl-CoA hydratase-related protein [Porticoccaceae bacterium]|nr:enoyl-CoA hydratase-related protein [Porticoccaceae bacterium]
MSENALLQELTPKGVLHLTMNRPEIHNAFDDHQVVRLIAALEDAATNPNVKVVVLASNGKSFSAGGDINYMRRMGSNTYEENLADGGQLAKLMHTLNFLPKPTIARVQGAAMGGGVGLVCCCDIAIGTTKARLALSEIKIGMLPATISPYVVRTIGEKAARRLFMTGEMVDAQWAQALGFLSEVVDTDEQLDAKIEEIADTLLKNAPRGLAKAKQLVFDVAQGDVDETMVQYTIKFIADVRDSHEGREGLSAFLEKRAPNW